MGYVSDRFRPPKKMELPAEVLVGVFAYLPPRDLEVVPLVCHKWREAAGEPVWKRQFFDRFGTLDVKPLKPQDTINWRRELIQRLEVLHLWRKGKFKNVSYNSTLHDVTDIFPDFPSTRLVCYNRHFGIGNFSDLQTGKVAKRRFYASQRGHQHHPVAAVDGSRLGMIYGFYDGTVATVTFSKESGVLAYRELPYKHRSSVVVVWVAKGARNATDSGAAISAVSAGHDGQIYLTRSSEVEKYETGQPILAMQCNGEVVWALDSARTVWEVREGAFTQIGTLNTIDDASMHVCGGGNLIIKTSTKIWAVNDGYTSDYELPQHLSNHKLGAFAVSNNYVAVAVRDIIVVWQLGRLSPFKWYSSPIPRDHIVDALQKPPITRLALNDVVLLVAGYNGLAIAVDLLTGTILRQVSTRISKNVLEYRRYSADGLVPVTALEIDQDPWQPHGVIGVRPMIQYFDLGTAKPAALAKKRRRAPAPRSSESADRQVAESLELAAIDQERQEFLEGLRQEYAPEDLDENEQLEYAMMLSRDDPGENSELLHALEISRSDSTSRDPDLDLAIRLSLEDNN